MRLLVIIWILLLSYNLKAQVDLGLHIQHFDFEDFWNHDGTPIHNELRLDSTVRTTQSSFNGNGYECNGYSFTYENCQLVKIIHNNEGVWPNISEIECLGNLDGGSAVLTYEEDRVINSNAKGFTFSEAYETTNSYEYDSLGRETLHAYKRESSVVTPNSSHNYSKRTSYNNAGKTTSIAYNYGNAVYFHYDSLCNLISSNSHFEFSDWYENKITDSYSFYTYPPNSIIRLDSTHIMRIREIGAPIQDTTYTIIISRNEQLFDNEGRVIIDATEMTINGEPHSKELTETSYYLTDDGSIKEEIKYSGIDSLIRNESKLWYYNDDDLLVKHQTFDDTDDSNLVNEIIWQYNAYGLPILRQSESSTYEYFYAYRVDENPVTCAEYSSVKNIATSFSISPNPSDNSFIIKNEREFRKASYLQIYALDGRLMHSHFFSGSEDNYEFGNELQRGTYIVVLFENGQPSFTQKVIKI